MARIKIDLDTAGLWLVVSADETVHESTAYDPATGQNVTTSERHVTMTLESEKRSLALIFMLEGAAGGVPSSGRLLYRGNSFDFADAALLAKLDGFVDGVNQLYADELTALLDAET